MGEMSLWDRISGWLRHPLGQVAAAITISYCNRHDLVLDYRQQD